MSLSGIIGADASELPLCLSEVWDDGVPLDDAEKRECIRLFCLLMRDRSITEDGAKIAIIEWSGNPALTESECCRAYASSEKLTCKLLQNVRYVGERCEREFCEFPRLRKTAMSTSAEEGQRGHEGVTLQDLTRARGRKKRVNSETGEPELDPLTGDDTVPDLALSPTKASSAVLDHMLLRRSITDTKRDPDLWRYERGIWRPDGEEVIEVLINSVAGDLSYERVRQEIYKRIRGMVRRVAFDADPYLLPAQDGLVNLKTGEVSDYGPEAYVTFKYGAEADKSEADIKPALWLLCSSLPDPRDVLTALDICAEAVIRRPSDSIIQLIGSGANGKGMYERMISVLVTDERITSITLAEAKASRFGPGAVLGKDLWVLSEVEEVRQAINLLKKVATGERMDSDLKYGGRIQGKPHVLPILDCNNAIDFGDDSWGRKRRVIKLDFPYTFDYVPGTRRKDPHLEQKITSPAALAGLLKIIVARAPHLIESKRIFNRKRPDEMAEEYRRQQYSLHYFCEECLTINEEEALGDQWPGSTPPRLTTSALYEEYQEYCRLFHVPVPAEKGQIGKYLKEKFGVSSVATREQNQGVRYYPGLWMAKSAKLARAEMFLSFGSNSSNTLATAQQQREDKENSISSLLATVATEDWPKEVLTEIERMYDFIESCEDPQQISLDDYLQNPVATVAPVAKGQQITISEKSAVAKDHSAVAEHVAKRNPGWGGWSGDRPSMSKIDMPTPERRELTPATPADESLDSEKAKSQPPQIDRLIVVRFLREVPAFVGLDGLTYGPFQVEDVATIPEINARGLFKKDAIVAVNVGGGKS